MTQSLEQGTHNQGLVGILSSILITTYKGIPRTLSNICDGAFSQKYFRERTPHHVKERSIMYA